VPRTVGMAAFLFSFPACVLAALALDRVTTASSWMYVFWAGVTPDKLQALEAALPWLSRGALLFLSTQNRIRAGALLLVLALLTIADTWRIDHLFLQYEQPADSPDLRTTNPGTKAFLEQQPRRFRVLPLPDYRWLSHPRYHVPGVDGVTGFTRQALNPALSRRNASSGSAVDVRATNTVPARARSALTSAASSSPAAG